MTDFRVNQAGLDAVAFDARKAGIDISGEDVEGAAKETVHVLTGNLRDEIGYQGVDPQANEGYVLADTDYAELEHNGTRHREAHPYFTEAIDVVAASPDG